MQVQDLQENPKPSGKEKTDGRPAPRACRRPAGSKRVPHPQQGDAPEPGQAPHAVRTAAVRTDHGPRTLDDNGPWERVDGISRDVNGIMVKNSPGPCAEKSRDTHETVHERSAQLHLLRPQPGTTQRPTPGERKRGVTARQDTNCD